MPPAGSSGEEIGKWVTSGVFFGGLRVNDHAVAQWRVFDQLHDFRNLFITTSWSMNGRTKRPRGSTDASKPQPVVAPPMCFVTASGYTDVVDHHPQPAIVGAVNLGGTTTSGEAVVISAMETPIRVSEADRLDKEVVERAHLERFRCDYLVRQGEMPFDGVERGGDPPDFVVRKGSARIGVDCAVLTVGQRRRGYRRFLEFLAHVAAQDPGPFAALRDCIVTTWFNVEVSDGGLPPGAHERALIDEMTDLLRTARPDREKIAAFNQEVAVSGFPETFPADLGNIHTASDGSGFNIAPVTPGTLQGTFAEQMGFACELNMSVQVAESDLRDEIQRLINKHDQPMIDHLLLTVGGPDTYGLRYPGEELVARMLLAGAATGLAAQRLKRVTVHLYTEGDFADLPLT